ncbi:hypothetical protein BDN70DRAFT_883237 [Pholiota conissans]|uniref:Uncharacterized protein n=1 Tax=Pholiota conissans TaxID=109636 RepID=A0A9P6CXN8_9AGAR|nr:hypothetical protein BDN70DRAFT_883237 [Pholiota conissans]
MSQSDPYLTAFSLLSRLHFLLSLSSNSLYVTIYFLSSLLFTVEPFTIFNGLLTSNTYGEITNSLTTTDSLR